MLGQTLGDLGGKRRALPQFRSTTFLPSISFFRTPSTCSSTPHRAQVRMPHAAHLFLIHPRRNSLPLPPDRGCIFFRGCICSTLREKLLRCICGKGVCLRVGRPSEHVVGSMAMRGAMARTSVHGSMRGGSGLSTCPTNGNKVQMKEKSFMCQVRKRADGWKPRRRKKQAAAHTCAVMACVRTKRCDRERKRRNGGTNGRRDDVDVDGRHVLTKHACSRWW